MLSTLASTGFEETHQIWLLQLRSTDSQGTILRRLRSLMPRAQLVHYMCAHKSMPFTFKYLKDLYQQVGISYGKKGPDKVSHDGLQRTELFPCRKGCGHKSATNTARLQHEKECSTIVRQGWHYWVVHAQDDLVQSSALHPMKCSRKQ